MTDTQLKLASAKAGIYWLSRRKNPKAELASGLSHLIQTWPLCSLCWRLSQEALPMGARWPPALRAPSSQLDCPCRQSCTGRSWPCLSSGPVPEAATRGGRSEQPSLVTEQRRGISPKENEGSVGHTKEAEAEWAETERHILWGFIRLPGSLSSLLCELGQVLAFDFLLGTMGTIP